MWVQHQYCLCAVYLALPALVGAAAALAGLIVSAVLYQYPFLLSGGMPLPAPNLPKYQAIFLLSPYILLGLALMAAMFDELGWKSNTRTQRWIEVGKITLRVAYALVVI